MDEARISALVRELFLRGHPESPLPPEADLLQQGICDSLGFVHLAAELERLVPGLRVHDADVTPENLGSVARIVAYLQRQP